MTDTGNQGGWHLDKRVPIALIVGLAVQAAGFGYWAAQIDGRVATNSRDIMRVESQVQAIVSTGQAQAVQMGRMEESLNGIRAEMARLVRALENGGGR